MTKKLWGGRFTKDLQKDAGDYVQSIQVDKEMVLEDIWGSQAHSIMLAKQKIITEEDLKQILKWLVKAEDDYTKGKFLLNESNEDVHMNVESYLIDGAGKEYGGKLHTARSRNDQVVTDARLYIRQRILEIKSLIIELQKTFLNIASNHLETPMPGYTHTQDAQPITLAYWATAYVSMFMRDIDRLDHAYNTVNQNPLGSAALAGTSFPIDRKFTTKLLGFEKVFTHSLDAISSRDFIAETLAALAIHMANMSKIAEEMVMWSTFEFGLVTIDDSYTAGSSIMPQKKNPCVAELARGRTGAVYGSLIQILTLMKSIPMGYNRDLQEDKPPLWNALHTVKSTLTVMNGMISTLQFNEERMRELAGANFTTATELANYLVRDHFLTFRESHEIVGGLVGKLVEEGADFSDFDLVGKILKRKGIIVPFTVLRGIIDPEQTVYTYKSLGSTAPDQVEKMIMEFAGQIKDREAASEKQAARILKAREKTKKIVEGVLGNKALKEII